MKQIRKLQLYPQFIDFHRLHSQIVVKRETQRTQGNTARLQPILPQSLCMHICINPSINPIFLFKANIYHIQYGLLSAQNETVLKFEQVRKKKFTATVQYCIHVMYNPGYNPLTLCIMSLIFFNIQVLIWSRYVITI